MKFKIKNSFLFFLIFELIFISLSTLLIYIYLKINSISINNIFFSNPNFLYLLALIPLFYIYSYFSFRKRENNLTKAFSENLKQKLINSSYSKKWRVKTILIRTTLFFLILALSQPIVGNKTIKIDSKNVEIVLSIDVSNSMNTKDLSESLSRLTVVKRGIIQMLNFLNGEKLGISVFAGSAYVQLPITEDYSAAKLFINDINTSIVSNQGTNIASAIETAKNMFSNRKSNKVIFLFTDGEHHEGNINEALTDIKKTDIQVLLIGVGSDKGGAVPKIADKFEYGYKRDSKGNIVISKLNKKMIKDIAKNINSKYTFIQTPFPDIHNMLKQIKSSKSYINQLENNSIEIKVQKRTFRFFVLMILLTLILFFFQPFLDKSKYL